MPAEIAYWEEPGKKPGKKGVRQKHGVSPKKKKKKSYANLPIKCKSPYSSKYHTEELSLTLNSLIALPLLAHLLIILFLPSEVYREPTAEQSPLLRKMFVFPETNKSFIF